MALFQMSISYGGEVEWHHSRSQSAMVVKGIDTVPEVNQLWWCSGMASFQKSISYGGEVEWHHSRSQSAMVVKWNGIIPEVNQLW